MNITTSGIPELEAELNRLGSIRWAAVIKKQSTEMLNRARAQGGTPIDTGELRLSSGMSGDEIGYTAEYAAHVEYGHRTANGGYVQGLRFLQQNADAQRPIYRQALVDAIRKEKG